MIIIFLFFHFLTEFVSFAQYEPQQHDNSYFRRDDSAEFERSVRKLFPPHDRHDYRIDKQDERDKVVGFFHRTAIFV